MIRLTTKTSMILLLAGLAGLTQPAPAGAALFNDANLEAVVRKLVFAKKNNTEPLTADDVKNISTINGKSKEITDLSGLENCKSLASLDLADNAISGLSPLAGLKNLQSLNLAQNLIDDVTPLAGLAKLQYLHLADNQISDIKPLGKLTKLTALYLTKNQVGDISALGGLQRLWSLYLKGNKVADIKPLAKLKNLSSLDLTGNGVKDIAPLAGLTELKFLFLDRNQVSELTTLVAMAKKDAAGDKRFAPYWRVFLAGNPLSEAARKTQLAELRGIGGRIAFDDGTPAPKPKPKPAPTPPTPKELLAQLAGDWTVTMKIFEPGKDKANESAGSVTKTSILGGSYIREDFKSKINGQPFEGTGLFGYDSMSKQYTSVWVDSLTGSVSKSAGGFDFANKTFTLNGEGADGKKVRIVLRITGKDTHVSEIYDLKTPDKPVKLLEIAHQRKK